ncbi:AMP-dependent synthetase/ligase [Specibacter sp. RAF43]|uniref:AMP-dependent synthetase/ligase n=1 Tax=Specibacter sp. RAF43 TaxID=3233057 RepID=UPI003F966CAE
MTRATSNAERDPHFPLDAPSIAAAFQRTVARYADRIGIRTIGSGTELTWKEMDTRIRAIAAGIHALGLKPGDTLGLMLPNTIECHLIDWAATHLGVVPFAIFNTSSPEQISYQLRNAGARVFVTQESFLDRVKPAIKDLGNQVQHLIITSGDGGTMSLAELEATNPSSLDFDAAWQSIAEDDIATMIYTSGTTGPPKAVEWSNRSALSQQRALIGVVPMPQESVVSFQPLAHAGGRVTSHYMPLAYGATVTVCPDFGLLAEHIRDARPDVLFSTPRLWEKLQIAIQSLIESDPDSNIGSILEANLQCVHSEDFAVSGMDAARQLAQLKIQPFRRALTALGLERLKVAFIGGATSIPELVHFFRAIGVPLLEAYGGTETALPIFNRVEAFKTGTAGRALPGVELKVAEDGELLVRSGMNMVGYRNQPEQTAEVIDSNGYLHTGDIVTIDDDGFVAIVDRKKEIIINSWGKTMSPAQIESTIKAESPLIGHVLAVGDGRQYVTGLITLDPDAVPLFRDRFDLAPGDLGDFIAAQEIVESIQAAVLRGNARLNSNEQLKKFTILPEFWLPDSDELTPTGKLKRRTILPKYAAEIAAHYA